MNRTKLSNRRAYNTAPGWLSFGKKGNIITMQITEAFKGKTLVITGGTKSPGTVLLDSFCEWKKSTRSVPGDF